MKTYLFTKDSGLVILRNEKPLPNKKGFDLAFGDFKHHYEEALANWKAASEEIIVPKEQEVNFRQHAAKILFNAFNGHIESGVEIPPDCFEVLLAAHHEDKWSSTVKFEYRAYFVDKDSRANEKAAGNEYCGCESPAIGFHNAHSIDDKGVHCKRCKLPFPKTPIEEIHSEFFKKFGEQSFRGYPLEQCWSIWEFFAPHLKSPNSHEPNT